MFQHLKKRRWATPALAVLLLLLALGAALVWRSRLNGTERALVGTWRRCDELQGQMTFTSDRQMVGDIPFCAGVSVRWRAADSMVWIWSEHQLPLQWNTLGTSFRRFLNPPDRSFQHTIEFDEQGRLRLTSPVGSFSMTSTWDESVDRRPHSGWRRTAPAGQALLEAVSETCSAPRCSPRAVPGGKAVSAQPDVPADPGPAGSLAPPEALSFREPWATAGAQFRKPASRAPLSRPGESQGKRSDEEGPPHPVRAWTRNMFAGSRALIASGGQQRAGPASVPLDRGGISVTTRSVDPAASVLHAVLK